MPKNRVIWTKKLSRYRTSNRRVIYAVRWRGSEVRKVVERESCEVHLPSRDPVTKVVEAVMSCSSAEAAQMG